MSNIRMIPVQSSNVRAYGFQPSRGPIQLARIIVQFDAGAYECVRNDGDATLTEASWNEFVAAPSKGSWYDQNIKKRPDVWTVRKLDAETSARVVPEETQGALVQQLVGESAERREQVRAEDDTRPVAATEEAGQNAPRNLVLVIADMRELIPESRTDLHARLYELQQLAAGFRTSAEVPEEMWKATSAALKLHIGELSEWGESWKAAVWHVFNGYGATTQTVEKPDAREESGVERRVREEAERLIAWQGTKDYQSQSQSTPMRSTANYAGIRQLLLTVGLPQSGKSRWARVTGFPIVCPDSIRLALHGQAYEPLAEPFVWAIAKLMVRALFLAGHSIVIVDACNVTRQRRDEWRGGEWETFCVPFECSREKARARRHTRELGRLRIGTAARSY